MCNDKEAGRDVSGTLFPADISEQVEETQTRVIVCLQSTKQRLDTLTHPCNSIFVRTFIRLMYDPPLPPTYHLKTVKTS